MLKKLTKVLSLLLIFCLVVSMFPAAALADEGAEDPVVTEVPEETTPVVTSAPEVTPVPEQTPAPSDPPVGSESTGGDDPAGDVSADDESADDDEPGNYTLSNPDEGVAVTSLTMGTKPDDGTTTGNPFVQGTGGSNSFRIPAMVTLNDGTLVAAADARWNTTYDGGGLDTIVSYSSDNGANWSYTFANYLGDNGNTYNGSGSTAFIDPALATDGSTVYMLCDLYPYGVALNGSGNTAPSTAVGFNDDGTLKLAANGSSTYNYYLKDGQIYDSTDSVVSGYTVDAYFNITGNGYDTNLFFSDSPYQVVRTGYLYLTKSTDGGASWSEPTLIPNVKTSSEQVCLVGPGRGLVTSTGAIVFPVYKYNGSSDSQRMGFIYSYDAETWYRVDSSISWSSEAAVVELADGTLRFFYRNGTSALCYVDYSWTDGWGSAANTGIATNSNTQISAISLQNTVEEKQVILVSCPTGPNEAGSSSSSASNRLNGKIFVGLVNADGTMSWLDSAKISVPSVNSSNQFMYSCLSALTDKAGNETGKIAILYEDYESAWGDGYYTMSFKTFDLTDNVTFDPVENEDIYVDNGEDGTGITIDFGGAAVAADAVTITAAEPEVLSDKTYVAYDIAVTGFSGTSATVTIPLNNAFADDATLYAVYINDSGKIAETINGTYDTVTDTFTFEAKHFSTYAVLAEAAESELPEYTDTYPEVITLVVDGVKTVTVPDVNYEATFDNSGLDTTIAQVTVKGTTTEGTEAQEEQKTKVNSLSAGTYIIGNGTQWLTLSGTTLSYTTDPSQATEWTIAASGSSWTIKSGSYYLFHSTNSAGSLSASTTSSTWNYNSNKGFYYTYRSWFSTYTVYLRWSGNAWEASTTDSNYGAAYTYTPGQDAVEGKAYTEITFTGVTAGETQVVVGETLYNITVTRKPQNVDLSIGGSITIEDAKAGTVEVGNSAVVEASLTDGVITITGLAEGTTTVTTNTTVYNVTVKEVPPVVDMNTTPFISETGNYAGSKVTKLTTSVNKVYDLNLNISGSNIVWSSADESIATVDQNGKITAIAEGETTVTCTVDGVAYTIPVVVLYNETYLANGSYDYLCDLYIAEITNTTVKYSINLDTNLLDAQEGEAIYLGFDYQFCIDFFGMQDDGHALTFMAATGSKGEYYSLYEVDDVTSLDVYKNGAMHWQAVEMEDGDSRVQTLLKSVISAGYNGATGFTRTQNNGSISSSLTFRSQKLPTVEKTIVSVNDVQYTEGMTATAGDQIVYDVTVTQYETTEAITYSSVTLKDNLSGAKFTSNNSDSVVPSLSNSTLTSDKTYSYEVTYTLTADDLDTDIINTVELKYDYTAEYSSGTFGGSAKAEAKISAPTFVPKDIVIDFGLPVTIDYSASDAHGRYDLESGSATYGEVAVTDNKVTYTPTQTLKGIDTVTLRNVKGAEYTFKVYPATTVYYEEGFATYADGWTDTGSKGSNAQTTEIAGSKSNNYGYDGVYSSVGASNSSQASSAAADKAEFVFTGTGLDIYANCTTESGAVNILITNSAGSIVKMLQVNTKTGAGDTVATAGQGVPSYSLPIASVTGLAHDTYTVSIRHIRTSTEDGYKQIQLDGFRVYGTLVNQKETVYVSDLEDDPSFVELRNAVLVGCSVAEVKDSEYYTADELAENIAEQVLNNTESGAAAVVLDDGGVYTSANVQDLLDNGPKNEVFLRSGQTIVFKVTTKRVVQIGLKAVDQTTSYTINNGADTSISSSTDMFYSVFSKAETESAQTITIKNTGNGILSITKLKICDDPGATLGELTEEDLIPALVSLGFELEPEEPEVQYADATLTVEVNGKTAVLTKNGVVGESATFTAAEIEAAAQGLVPDGYMLKDQAQDVTVAYGASTTVSLRAEEIPTEPEQPEEPEQPTEPEKPEQPSKPANIVSAVIRLIDRIFGSLKGLFR